MRRSGYTLMELMLVIAVLVLTAALSVPAIDVMLASNRVSAARDMVRARWAEMRGRAMLEGRAYRFAVTENTGKFRVAPDDDAYWSGRSDHQDEDKPLIVEGELPDEVLFTTSESAFAGNEGVPQPGPQWGLAVVIYLPNGSAADDAKVYFGKAGQNVLGLQLRALTGAVSAIEPSSNPNTEEVPP